MSSGHTVNCGLDAKEAAKKAAKAIKGGDREEAKRLLSERANGNGETPCPRLIVNDATVEKLGELLNEYNSDYRLADSAARRRRLLWSQQVWRERPWRRSWPGIGRCRRGLAGRRLAHGLIGPLLAAISSMRRASGLAVLVHLIT
jgi:hypothetical protein